MHPNQPPRQLLMKDMDLRCSAEATATAVELCLPKLIEERKNSRMRAPLQRLSTSGCCGSSDTARTCSSLAASAIRSSWATTKSPISSCRSSNQTCGCWIVVRWSRHLPLFNKNSKFVYIINLMMKVDEIHQVLRGNLNKVGKVERSDGSENCRWFKN